MQLKVVISDIQWPFSDKRAIANVAEFIREMEPDAVLCVGDVLDAPQVSRWTKGMHGEYQKTLGQDRDGAARVLEQLKVTDLSRSNHDDRLETYVRKYAPGLWGLPELTTEKFLRLDEIGVKFHRQLADVAPGWVMAHGDEGSLSQTPGTTALGLAKKVGKSVVCGHTHRAAVQHFHTGYNGKVTQRLWGMEVGNLMNMPEASYLKFGGANWQQAFGLLEIDGQNVTPTVVPIHKDGTFQALGYKWGGK